MDRQRKSRGAIRRTRKRKKIFMFIMLIVFAIGGYFVYQAYRAAHLAYEELGRPGEISEKRLASVAVGKDPVSILLLGVETYATEGENGRADTQIVVTLNPHTKKMTMTSIPRDTMVQLPATKAGQYAGTHKINATYTYGAITGYGANRLAVEAVENLLDIPIDEYITIGFDGFRNIINVLGGVTVDIKEAFWEKDIYHHNKRIYFNKGKTTLNGEEALAFVRMRKRAVNSIYPREERQRQLIRAAVDQAISAGTLFKIGQIADIIGKDIDTSLKPIEIYALQQTYASIDTNTIETIEIKGNNQLVNGSSYFIPSEGAIDNVTTKLKKQLVLP